MYYTVRPVLIVNLLHVDPLIDRVLHSACAYSRAPYVAIDGVYPLRRMDASNLIYCLLGTALESTDAMLTFTNVHGMAGTAMDTCVGARNCAATVRHVSNCSDCFSSFASMRTNVIPVNCSLDAANITGISSSFLFHGFTSQDVTLVFRNVSFATNNSLSVICQFAVRCSLTVEGLTYSNHVLVGSGMLSRNMTVAIRNVYMTTDLAIDYEDVLSSRTTSQVCTERLIPAAQCSILASLAVQSSVTDGLDFLVENAILDVRGRNFGYVGRGAVRAKFVFRNVSLLLELQRDVGAGDGANRLGRRLHQQLRHVVRQPPVGAAAAADARASVRHSVSLRGRS
jgi:hypothetical protein